MPRAEWLYLATVIDLYSSKVVDWSISDHLTAALVCGPWRMGLWHRGLTNAKDAAIGDTLVIGPLTFPASTQHSSIDLSNRED